VTRGLATSQRARGESGDTLIEVLVALVIMGLAFTVIVGGIGTAIIGAALQQNQTTADSFIRSAAEVVTSDGYISCAKNTADAATPMETYALPATPNGFTLSIAIVGFWDPTTNMFDTHPPSCEAPPLTDSGLQMVTLSVSGGDVHASQTATLDVVKRQP
jgi:type II secretory pathway pseudopilin PulG